MMNPEAGSVVSRIYFTSSLAKASSEQARGNKKNASEESESKGAPILWGPAE